MSVILARGLGPSLMGDLSYVIWAERTLIALASLGYMYATVRYTAETFGRGEGHRAWGVVRLFLRRQIITTAIVVAVVVPIILTVAPAGLQAPILVVALTLFFITIEGIYTHALQGAQRYDITARTSMIKMGLQVPVAGLVVYYGGGVTLLLATLGVTLLVVAPDPAQPRAGRVPGQSGGPGHADDRGDARVHRAPVHRHGARLDRLGSLGGFLPGILRHLGGHRLLQPGLRAGRPRHDHSEHRGRSAAAGVLRAARSGRARRVREPLPHRLRYVALVGAPWRRWSPRWRRR
jgi:hypothetical protein